MPISRIVLTFVVGALLTTNAWAQQARVMHPDAVCTATPAQIEANITFDVFRVRNGKLVEHWDGAVINPPAPAAGRGQ
jgi:predicted SnoaL-like aldol condensation-catalyzing enzyme